jgi:hypothetical protein
MKIEAERTTSSHYPSQAYIHEGTALNLFFMLEVIVFLLVVMFIFEETEE